MKPLALTLAALLAIGPTLAQDGAARPGQRRNTAYAELETLLATIRKTKPAERKEFFDRLYRQCGEFLDEHLASASAEQLSLAGGTWLQLALRAGDTKALEARLRRLEAHKTLPPDLRRLVRLHRARLDVKVGAQAPAWRGVDLRTGDALTSADQKGKLVLLIFWSSRHPNAVTFLERKATPLHARFGADEGFVLVGVGVLGRGESAETLRTFAKARGLPGRQIFDASGDCATDYGAVDVPFVCLVGPRGAILALGPAWRTVDRVVKILDERLAPSPQDEDGDEQR